MFTAAKRWARFCKPGCRNDWHRKKALGPDGRLSELERPVAELERRLSVLDEPVR